MSVAAVILAAGKGNRMGGPKWQLTMPSGELIVQHLYRQFCQFGCETVLVVSADDYDLLAKDERFGNIQLAINSRYDLGRLYSLQCGLKHLASAKPTFVHNIDNPYVSQDVLSNLLNGMAGFDYALPQFDRRGGHPLIMAGKLAERIVTIENTFPDFRTFLQGYRGNRVTVDSPEILLNINTPEEYSRFCNLHGNQP